MEIEILYTVGSFLKCLHQLELCQAETRIWELNTGLPYGWQGFTYLVHQCCFPGYELLESWGWK